MWPWLLCFWLCAKQTAQWKPAAFFFSSVRSCCSSHRHAVKTNKVFVLLSVRPSLMLSFPSCCTRESQSGPVLSTFPSCACTASHLHCLSLSLAPTLSSTPFVNPSLIPLLLSLTSCQHSALLPVPSMWEWKCHQDGSCFLLWLFQSSAHHFKKAMYFTTLNTNISIRHFPHCSSRLRPLLTPPLWNGSRWLFEFCSLGSVGCVVSRCRTETTKAWPERCSRPTAVKSPPLFLFFPSFLRKLQPEANDQRWKSQKRLIVQHLAVSLLSVLLQTLQYFPSALNALLRTPLERCRHWILVWSWQSLLVWRVLGHLWTFLAAIMLHRPRED